MSVRPRECTTRHFPVCLRPADGVTVTSGEVHDTEEERERVTRGPREGRAFSVASTVASPGLDGPRVEGQSAAGFGSALILSRFLTF